MNTYRIFLQLCLAALVNSSTLVDRVRAVALEHNNRGHRDQIESGSFPQPLGGGCPISCRVLAEIFPGQVDLPGQAAYSSDQLGYWSQQQQLQQPTCRFNPTQALEVSVTVIVSRLTHCPFAVKSGGHASFYNASNIEGGLAIDLKNLNSIAVSEDRNTTAVGAGNRWQQVYEHLIPQNLAVIGGRNSDIGVSGLTLGGGISFFSGFHGWACDNVRNYQVVIANGRILEVNATSYPDLYFALRGGGNNFGIVTRLDLETFEHGDMWGGFTFYPPTANSTLYDAFYWFNYNSATDPRAALIVAVSHINGLGYVMANNYEFIDPTPFPPVFENFTSVANLSSTQRVTNLTDLTTELKNTQPSGLRQIFITMTLRNDAQIMKDILNIFTAEIEPIINITDFLPSLVFQPLQLAVISNFAKAGGNTLGIDSSDGPLIIMDVNLTWGDDEDDDAAQCAAQAVIAKATQLAKSRGLYHRYLYQNYAYIAQDVISSYGAANKRRLFEIERKYDPKRVFQRLQPGYFKLRR